MNGRPYFKLVALILSFVVAMIGLALLVMAGPRFLSH
jgi:hypothetical protein